ncbi:4-methyl-5(b-hydroxyethyl)-thiazole monophosphate biosynthesis [Parabacteroides sp. PFB2-10]|uniref:DJ-1 family glyoxalase III n=1 Tax=Parabacteroides sp. PFB2-10 TaxID=1742405 RepID=UPI002476A320|nr:DJ-1 family glyoxalase III [Parabacteroides sp. PFB2-10]MDH6312004.1 4-methyl-5(b-hydroxyethyl)-thiazole monophosphate biosynthesis [Parabacteroides sp. PFB2-10]MDL2245244.1 DJ-1/PfpI family protein [Parabacteroides sp. OttesenSCG-928-J18]
MKTAFVFLATGFEETEAVGTIDVLRRGGIETTVVSITGEIMVEGAHGLGVVADLLYEDADLSAADALVLPGGMPGSNNLNAFKPLKEQLVAQDQKGKIVAAICAAPLVLGGLGLLKGRRATCYPSFESALTGAVVSDAAVEVDGHVITGRGPGLVFNFGLALVEALRGKAVAEEVAAGLLLA